ncbi:two-component regulator propeller domain-containing protein [Edaphobacter modestus]|uniref:two-component regulator propeller domain-containing protein n=1 Tax=Edaphobacter modestus TaxID=388466 RepID=UPI0013EED42A|nr:two-component regulator propeller domain-containing protein [Edaphobacter modestus]
MPSSRINSLLGARDGSLWIGTTVGLAHWRDGELTNYRDPAGSIMAIVEDRAGTIWIARANISDTKGPLCKVTDTGLRCYGRDDGVAVPYAVTLAKDSLGNMWLAGGPMVSRWQTSSADTYVAAGLDPAEIFNGVLALAGRPDGSLWVGLVHAGKGGGLQQLVQGAWKPFVTPEVDGSTLEVTALLLDRDSSLWVGTLSRGIYRIQGDKVDHFSSSDGLSGDAVTGLFQDHEGNIWIATSRGIDNFHDLRVASFSTRQGLSADQVNSVLASRDGTVWIGTYNLDVLRSGKITSIQRRNGLPGRAMTSLLEDRAGRLWVGVDEDLSVYERGNFRKIPTGDGSPLGAVRAMTEDVDGSIWVATNTLATNRHRLFRIQNLRIREDISSPQLPAINMLAPDPHGGVWLGLARGGLARFRNGQMEFFPLSGHHDDPVYGLLVNSDASILAATQSGLVGWKNGTVQTLTVRNGLPCDVMYSLISDRKATLWLYAACGVIAIPKTELQRWWESPNATVKSRLFDVFDGARPMSTPFKPNASQSPDGRLWFANQNDVQMIDPAHLDSNPILPPVHIEEIIADHKNYAPRDGLRLPALTRNLGIDYTALSFVAPQKVRFRYKLESHDPEWQDPGTRRQAFYADLRPGNYRFRVTACNNDGIWNEEGATLVFSVAAAWYQTWWFRGASLAVFLALLWALYRWRIQQIQRQEKQLRNVIDTIPALAFSSSPDGKNEWVNRHWEEYSGLSIEKTVGSGWEAAVHPEDIKRFVEKWRAAVASGKPFENEVRLRRAADAQYRWFLTRAVPLRDARGKILKWYGISTDFEDHKRAEQLQAELAHINRVTTMGELTASLAHELKQPIAAAITNANVCLRWLKRDTPDLEEACAATRRILEDQKRAAEVIEHLRSLYKKSPPQRELVEVNEIVHEMVTLLQGEANRFAVSMRTDLAADLPRITADPVQLQQVLMNLMLNAIEAMKETGGVLTVKSQRDGDDQLLISVSDTGVGLPTEKADQIFDAFFTTKTQGSGMGLAISCSIVESHGGRLWATPNDGRGATFHFTLPSERTHSRLTA